MLKFGDYFNFSENKCLAFYDGKREDCYWLQTVGGRYIAGETDWNAYGEQEGKENICTERQSGVRCSE